MLGHIVLKKKNIPELESLIASLKTLPGEDIELNVDAGFFDRDNPIFTKPEKVKARARAVPPSDDLRIRIREWANANDMSISELSAKLGKSSGYLYQYLGGGINNLHPNVQANLLNIIREKTLSAVKAA